VPRCGIHSIVIGTLAGQDLRAMHFDFLPKVTHNEDAVREYEREENHRIRRWLKRLVIALPFILLIVWLYFHWR
jgi:hypothetical protein